MWVLIFTNTKCSKRPCRCRHGFSISGLWLFECKQIWIIQVKSFYKLHWICKLIIKIIAMDHFFLFSTNWLIEKYKNNEKKLPFYLTHQIIRATLTYFPLSFILLDWIESDLYNAQSGYIIWVLICNEQKRTFTVTEINSYQIQYKTTTRMCKFWTNHAIVMHTSNKIELSSNVRYLYIHWENMYAFER